MSDKPLKIEELSLEVQQKLYEKWSNDLGPDVDLDTDWYIEMASFIGISIDKIYWTGFWSQGDGACFVGKYEYKEGWREALNEAGYSEDNEAGGDGAVFKIGQALEDAQKTQDFQLIATVRQSGHYYMHSGCTSFWIGRTDDPEDWSFDEDLLIRPLRDFMNWVYKQLEADYTYQTSFEYFVDCDEGGYNEGGYNEDGSEWEAKEPKLLIGNDIFIPSNFSIMEALDKVKHLLPDSFIKQVEGMQNDYDLLEGTFDETTREVSYLQEHNGSLETEVDLLNKQISTLESLLAESSLLSK